MPKPKKRGWVTRKETVTETVKRKKFFENAPVHEFHFTGKTQLREVRRRMFVGQSRAVSQGVKYLDYAEFKKRLFKEFFSGLWRDFARKNNQDISNLQEMPSLFVITAKEIRGKVLERVKQLPKSMIFFPEYVKKAKGRERTRRMKEVGLITRTITLPRKVYESIRAEASRKPDVVKQHEVGKQSGFHGFNFYNAYIAEGIANYFIHRYWQAIDSISKEMQGRKSF